MKLRKKRYFFITLMLVALIGAYVGMGFFAPSSSSSETDISVSTTPTDPDDGVDADVGSNPSSSSTTKRIPTKPIELVNFALDIFNNGKGCQGTTTDLVNLKGHFAMDSTQKDASISYHMKGSMQRKGDEFMQDDYMWYDSLQPAEFAALLGSKIGEYSAVKTGYQAINVNTAEDSAIVVETKKATSISSYDLNDETGTKQTLKVNEVFDKYIILYGGEFPLEIKESTVTIKRNDYLSNPKVQYITLLYDVSKLPQNYGKFYKVYSAISDVQYTKYSFTFEISKKTGRLLSVTREEEFQQVKHYNFGLHMILNGETTAKITFSTMDNDSFEINRPYLKYTKPDPPKEEDKPSEEAQPNDKPESEAPQDPTTAN